MNDDTPNENVLSFAAHKASKEPKAVTQTAPIEYEFHFHPMEDQAGEAGEIVRASGYLKFGPQFIAVLAGLDPETSPIVFAVQTPMVKYVKQITTDGAIQGTLSV